MPHKVHQPLEWTDASRKEVEIAIQIANEAWERDELPGPELEQRLLFSTSRGCATDPTPSSARARGRKFKRQPSLRRAFLKHSIKNNILTAEKQEIPKDLSFSTKRDVNNKTRTAISSTAGNPSTEPCGPLRDAQTRPTTSTDERKITFHKRDTTAFSTETSPTNSLIEAEQMMFQALKQLQEIYNTSCKTKADKITIELVTFQKIATTFQQAYEKIKTKDAYTHLRFGKHEYPQHSVQYIEV